jgi:mRNA interferase RelE/StbE
MFKIEFSREASKSMKAIPRNIFERISGKIEQLGVNPFAPNNNVKKLEGTAGYRLRVGDWRVIYEVENDRLVIFVLAVGPRGGVYK